MFPNLGDSTKKKKKFLFHAIKITSSMEQNIPHILLLEKHVLQWTEEFDS